MLVRFNWCKTSGNSLVDMESKRQDGINKTKEREIENCETPWIWDDGACADDCRHYENCKLHEGKKK